MKRRPERALLLALALAVALGGCSLAPTYHAPEVPVADSYQKHGSELDKSWVPAQPADQLPRDGWWTLYSDAQLDQLQQKLLANNADLAAALAHYQQAQAFSAQARAGLFPQIGISGNAQRDRQSDTKPLRGATSPPLYDSYTLSGTFDYELDLWGRVRQTVEAGKDDALAAAADLASVRLSLQAQLADNVIVLRGLDQQIQLLQQSIEAYQKALQLTQTRHGGGIASGLDVARAQTQLSTVKSQWSQTLAQRELTEHAIAVLVGESASQFNVAADTKGIALPSIPASVPSTLLQRRPDIAAAERRTAAANARIGVARAAYFPSLSLSALGGYQSAAYGGLLTAPNRFWAIGPNLLLNVFDGGRRKATVEAAKAATDEAGAHYRGVVLGAFQQVEDNLTQLDRFGTARVDQQDAAVAAQRSLDLAMDRYRQGAVGYLDVVQAQTASLESQRTLLDLDTRRLRASVQLIRALGGGWSSEQLAQTHNKH
ncbi:efflux transporter outer membrane subunit [Dyella tabacisoli]|uniref:RND transporter n=1 Tax=Dyella tabacisoli TaxID=2282381 RepID=A0A369UVM1_9GAMM|nr:efflux transporter outer membrane subunit [Dyella tabacisoli]RDD82399.1 RND transporter [Dyella tabacisoli]